VAVAELDHAVLGVVAFSPHISTRHRTAAGLLALVVLNGQTPGGTRRCRFDVHLTPLGLPLLVLVGYWL